MSRESNLTGPQDGPFTEHRLGSEETLENGRPSPRPAPERPQDEDNDHHEPGGYSDDPSDNSNDEPRSVGFWHQDLGGARMHVFKHYYIICEWLCMRRNSTKTY